MTTFHTPHQVEGPITAEEFPRHPLQRGLSSPHPMTGLAIRLQAEDPTIAEKLQQPSLWPRKERRTLLLPTTTSLTLHLAEGPTTVEEFPPQHQAKSRRKQQQHPLRRRSTVLHTRLIASPSFHPGVARSTSNCFVLQESLSERWTLQLPICADIPSGSDCVRRRE